MAAPELCGSVLPVTRVELELTEVCDLACRFCYHPHSPRHNAHAVELLRRLAAAGVMELILTGGEPTLAPDFLEVLETAQKLFPRVMVQSNGVHFAEEDLFARLDASRIFCVNFSLHGPEAVHEAVTGVPGSFAATCAALRMAVNAGIRTASNLVLHSGNAAREILEESVAVLAATGCREMTMTRFIPVGLGAGRPLGLSRDAFFDAVRCLSDGCAAAGMSFLLANAAPLCQMPADLRHLCNRCSFGYDKFYIDVEGTVLTCGMGRVPLGNLLERTLEDLLADSAIYRKYTASAHLPSMCADCADLAICGGGCRAAGMAGTGELAGEDIL